MEQQRLFDQRAGTAAREPANVRQKLITAAFENADRRCREAYRAVLDRVISSGVPFTGEDVTAAYKADKRNPEPRSWKFTGGIFQGALHRGEIEIVGYARRENGNMTATYRGVK